MGALSKLDEFLWNPQVRTLSGTVPGTSWKKYLQNREATGDRSQSDPHPEVEFSTRRTINSTDSDPEETSHKYFLFYIVEVILQTKVTIAIHSQTQYVPFRTINLRLNVNAFYKSVDFQTEHDHVLMVISEHDYILSQLSRL